MRTIKNIFTSSKGFTLIEMAIVLVIFGTIVAASTTAYVQWQNWIRVDTTQTNIDDAYRAMEEFVQTNRRYPCPSSLIATRDTDSAGYGIERTGRCITGSTAGMFTVPGRTAPHIDTAGTLVNGPINVRIGALPYRSLGLDEDQAYDGYRDRLVYAVTEHLTVPTSFDPTTGAISIVDDNGQEYTDGIGGTGHFLIFSMGENGAGAFNREGFQQACDLTAAEGANCDFADAVFRLGEFSTASGTNALDDVMKFGQIDIPSWRRSDTSTDGILGGGQLGSGAASTVDPREELDITGTIKLRDDPSTVGNTEGKLKSESLCAFDAAGNNTDCFITSAIAGDIADGEGMECPNTDEFIRGISNNSPNCGIVEVSCGAGKIITGIDANGNVDCGDPPLPDCDSLGITLCTEPYVLPGDTPDGTVHTASVTSNGFPVTRDYTCSAGSWIGGAQNGTCNCTPTSSPPTTIPNGCEENSACGRKYTGDTTESTVVDCVNPSYIDRDRSGCTCDPTSEKTSNRNCSNTYWDNFLPDGFVPPSGYRYTNGQFTTTSKTICASSTSGSCGSNEYKAGAENCSCRNNNLSPLTRACQNGFSGQETKARQFQCDGTDLTDTTTHFTGTWGRTVTESTWNTDACTCDVGTHAGTEVACSQWQNGKIEKDGYTGIPTEFVTTNSAGVCSSTDEVFSVNPNSVCKDAPPQICRWKAYTEINPGTAGNDFQENKICNKNGVACGDSGTCEKSGTLFNCECE